jgi:hypothetical protein
MTTHNRGYLPMDDRQVCTKSGLSVRGMEGMHK